MSIESGLNLETMWGLSPKVKKTVHNGCGHIWATNRSGFKSRRRRHMWVEFVVGSLLCSERFFSGYSGFPLSSKTNISKFQFDQESGRRRTTLWMCYLQSLFIYFIHYLVKRGITIVSYFGNVTASLFALTIVRIFTPR